LNKIKITSPNFPLLTKERDLGRGKKIQENKSRRHKFLYTSINSMIIIAPLNAGLFFLLLFSEFYLSLILIIISLLKD